MTARQVVDQLNRMLQLDRNLTEKLVNTRYPVSEEYKKADEFVYSDEGAGLIGVLNGLVLDTENFRIAANYEDDAAMKLVGFSLLELQPGGRFISVYPDTNVVVTDEAK
jgi:hypothetical protein